MLEKHPSWVVTNSANGWISNEIALEWLEKVFLLQTAPSNLSEARLLILDGHGSHTTAEFMTTCYLHNVYLLFLPAHTSYVVSAIRSWLLFQLEDGLSEAVGRLGSPHRFHTCWQGPVSGFLLRSQKKRVYREEY